MNTMDLPIELVAPNDDPEATRRAVKRVQRSRNEARRASDRRWAVRRTALRQIAREEQLRAGQENEPAQTQQAQQRTGVLAGQVRAQLHALQEAYERGDGFHPETGAYKDEKNLPKRRLAALLAWRRGYRVDRHGVLRNPREIVLSVANKVCIVPQIRPGWRALPPNKRERQVPLSAPVTLIAGLCAFGPQVLRDGVCICLRDGNPRNLRYDNLFISDRATMAIAKGKKLRRKPRVPTPMPSLLRKDGRRRSGKWLTPQQAHAIRTLLALGWDYGRIQEELTRRGVPIQQQMIRLIDVGARWA